MQPPSTGLRNGFTNRPIFQLRWWYFDESGVRNEDLYRGQTKYADLNCLATSVFEKVVRDAGLRVER